MADDRDRDRDDSDRDDVESELGRAGKQLGGIADRFGGGTTGTSDTTRTSETTETTDPEPVPSVETTGTGDTMETTPTTETTETSETTTDGDEFRIREQWDGRTIYLPPEDRKQADWRFDELKLKLEREADGEIEIKKNHHYYPAVFRAALHGSSIEEEMRALIGLDELGLPE